MERAYNVRPAGLDDLKSILLIYNQGIEDKIATLEEEQKDMEYMRTWFDNHAGRFSVLIAEKVDEVVGWASLSPYSSRCAYAGVAELSIYIRKDQRGRGLGTLLIEPLPKCYIS